MRVKIFAYPTLRLTSILIRRSGSSGRFLLSYYRFHNPTIIAYYLLVMQDDLSISISVIARNLSY